MAFFTSIFRNLKNGGAVYEKPSRYHQWIIDNPGGIRKKDGGEVKSQFWRPLTAPIAYKEGGEVKSGFFYNLSKNPEMIKLIQKANNQPKAPIRMKEGGVVEKMTPFQEAIHRLNNMPTPIRRKKGGRIAKKSPGSKNHKKQKK